MDRETREREKRVEKRKHGGGVKRRERNEKKKIVERIEMKIITEGK